MVAQGVTWHNSKVFEPGFYDTQLKYIRTKIWIFSEQKGWNGKVDFAQIYPKEHGFESNFEQNIAHFAGVIKH